jgi:hypothetical protein
MMTLSLAALGSLIWLRKNKPKTLIRIIYACALLLATMPSITRLILPVMLHYLFMFSSKNYLLMFLCPTIIILY